MAGSVGGEEMGFRRARRMLPKSNVSVGRAIDIDNPRSVGQDDSNNHAKSGRGVRMLPSHSVCCVRVYIEEDAGRQ
jgi:hypothetical protein